MAQTKAAEKKMRSRLLFVWMSGDHYYMRKETANLLFNSDGSNVWEDALNYLSSNLAGAEKNACIAEFQSNVKDIAELDRTGRGDIQVLYIKGLGLRNSRWHAQNVCECVYSDDESGLNRELLKALLSSLGVPPKEVEKMTAGSPGVQTSVNGMLIMLL